MTFTPDREARILQLAENYRNAMEAYDVAKTTFEAAKKPIEEARALAKVRENEINVESRAIDAEKQRIKYSIRSAVLSGDQALILSGAAEMQALLAKLVALDNWAAERMAIRERVLTLTEEYYKLQDDWNSNQSRLANESCYAERAFESSIKEVE